MLLQLAAAPLAVPGRVQASAAAPVGSFAAASSYLPTVPAASSPVLTK